jgi:hypothetical protein
MTTASPVFGILYLASLCGALVAIVRGRSLVAGVRIALAAFAAIVAAYCVGMSARGISYDISGRQANAPAPAPQSAAQAARPALHAARPDGNDGEISIDGVDALTGPQARRVQINLASNGKITIVGWAFDAPEGSRCQAIAAVVGNQTFSGTYGSERPDVAAALGDGHRFTGYAIVVPGEALTAGAHRLEVRCFGANGRSYAGPTTLRVRVGQ